MSKNFKNILRRPRIFGDERRRNLTKEVLKDSTPLPNPLEYKDIDEEFCRWVEEDLPIVYEGENIPTVVLFTNQRFTEYMQSWENVDDKKNMLLNFKTITRENNPKSGTLLGSTKNIPGDRTYLMKRIEAVNESGKKYFIDYRVKQPFSVDLIYTVTLVTNKYQLLNEFNQIIQDKFKAIDCYIRPKGHFIPMKLNDISDESEYSLDNRQYYSQSYNITVMGYIMPKDSFIVEERPMLQLVGFENQRKKSTYADIEEIPCSPTIESPYAYTKTIITIHFDNCTFSYKFKIDCDFTLEKVEMDNVRGFTLHVNDTKLDKYSDLNVKTNDEIKISGVGKFKLNEDSEIKLIGYNPTDTYLKGFEDKTIIIDAN